MNGVVLALTLASLASPMRFALVVGNNEPLERSQRKLRFADDDAARFYELLGAASNHAHLLTTFDAESQATFPELIRTARRPSRLELEAAMADLRARIQVAKSEGHRTELYFYYAGHGGLVNDEGVVAFEDGALTRSEFRERVLLSSGADRTHVFVDACKSYFLVSGRGPGGSRRAVPGGYAGPDVTVGVGYVLSTSNDVESHEWARYGGGIVSHELRSALLGAADGDGNGAIDYDEVGAFMAVANEGIPVAKYRPRIFVQPPSDDRRAIVLDPGQIFQRALEVDEEIGGRVTLIDHRGVRYADANKSVGQSMRLALVQAERYEARWSGGVTPVDSRRWGRQQLSSLPVSPPSALAERSEIHRAFSHLFAMPFDRDVVRGFRLSRDIAVEMERAENETRVPRWVGLTTLGVGVAAVAGAVALSSASAAASHASRTAPQIERQGHADRAATLGTGAVVGFVAGGLGIGTGIVLVGISE
ncbi:MAG: caspase family protein [Deltaproteobacteria bacterium]